jgi:hypothetical protein
MATLTDHQYGMAAETVYGTPVTPSRFLRILESSKFQPDPMPLQGVGLSVGTPGGINLASRRIAGIGKASGTIAVEVVSKGLGVLLNACTGTSTVTQLGATACWQHNFTPNAVNTVLPAFTSQLSIVNNVGTSTPNTYTGCTVSQFELSCPEGGIMQLSADVDAKAWNTATALATASYGAADSIHTYVGGSITLGTTPAFVPPTTVALASAGGTVSGNVRSWSLSSSNNIDDGRWVMGARNQPTVGKRSHMLKFDYEYNDNTMRDALLSQSTLSFTATHTTTELIAPGNFATVQLAIPAIKINSGSFPEPTLGQTVKVSVDAEILWDGVNQPYYISVRTADIAL